MKPIKSKTIEERRGEIESAIIEFGEKIIDLVGGDIANGQVKGSSVKKAGEATDALVAYVEQQVKEAEERGRQERQAKTDKELLGAIESSTVAVDTATGTRLVRISEKLVTHLRTVDN